MQIKQMLTKLIMELNLPWTKVLSLALLRMRTKHRKDLGLSPCEMLLGLTYLGRESGFLTLETKVKVLRNYVLGLSSALSLFSESKGY